MNPTDIDQIRQFNRAVTQRIGVLQDSYLSRGRPLGEARLLFEIGKQGRDVSDLRAALGLDSAYMSRLLRSLERQKLVSVEKSARDARARRALLTAAGRKEFRAYDRLSDDLAASFLTPLDEARRARLVAAMSEVRRLLDAARIAIEAEPSSSNDASWCLEQYFAELAARFDQGFDPQAGKSVSAAEMTPPAGLFLLARLDGRPVGCAALLRLDDETAEIKRMWIAPEVRGLGLARRMLDQLESVALEWKFRRVRLDTNRALTEAQALYRRQGYAEIERYNDNPYAHCWFEKALSARTGK